MKYFYIFSFAFFGHILSLYAQPSDHFFNKQASHDHPVKYSSEKDSSAYLSKETIPDLNDQILYRIPVKFWIYRKSNGKDGLTYKDMKDQIEYLNFFHAINNTGIQFYLRPDIKFVDRNRLYVLNYISQAPWQTFLRRSKGCINIHVAGKLSQNRMFQKTSHYAGTYNRLSKGVLLAKGVSCPSLTHETGHYLGLKHPHKHWKSKWLQEPVDRDRKLRFSNKKACEKRGDDVCDTPAEPNLDVYTDNYCNYTGKLKDKYGDLYAPHTDNIMSYTQNRECRTTFTEGQIKRMHDKLSNIKYGKAWSINRKNADLFNFDLYEPDDLEEGASEIFINAPQNHTFHKIVSSKRKFKFEDHTDWLFLDVKQKEKKTLKIQFAQTKYLFPDIFISVYYNGSLIKEKIINSSLTENYIEVPETKPGKYYIKISQSGSYETITGYNISIIR